MLIALSIFAYVLGVVAYWMVLRYNLHMFQLNGYKNGEHIAWLKKNWRRQAILLVSGVFGIAAMLFTNKMVWMILTIVLLLLWAVVLRYYVYLKKTNTKKKLVFTKRVQRQVVTDVLISILLLGSAVFFLGYRRAIGGVAILIGLQLVQLLPVNIINRPVEKAVSNYFIRDAKKKLKGVPELIVVGVTGSYGKTSVKYYLQTLLQEKYSVLITPESYNTPMGVVKTIRESLKPTHQIFVCEMGARHVGDIKEICDIVHPRHGIITSVGPQHLETFFTMENIKKTKFELADALPEDGMLFLNGDNDYIKEYSQKYENTIFYQSREKKKGYVTSNVSLSQLGTEFTVTAPDGESESFQMRLIGEHNIINVVGAIAVAHSLGISLRELKVPVRRLQPVAHRMQMLEKGAVTIIDDAYNSNPVGSKAAVETLAMFDGIKILVTPGMVELGRKEEEFNYKFGTYAAKCCDYILLVGKKHTEPIRKGALDSGFPEEKCFVYEDLKDALNYAYAIKEAGHKYILLENDLPDNY